MKIIIGLGNPGKEYEKTRHNYGFQFIEYIANKNKLEFNKKFECLVAEFMVNDEKIILAKPQTFMNESGRAVRKIIDFYKTNPESIYIAFDDLDLKEGEFKVQKNKYPKVHNGINDILNKCKSDEFNFIRIGADGREEHLKKLISGRNYVLQKSNVDNKKVFEEIFRKLEFLECGGAEILSFH